MSQADSFRIRMLFEQLCKSFRLNGRTPCDLFLNAVAGEDAYQLSPPLAKLAGIDGDDLVALFEKA